VDIPTLVGIRAEIRRTQGSIHFVKEVKFVFSPSLLLKFKPGLSL